MIHDAAQSVVGEFASLTDDRSRQAALQGIWNFLTPRQIRDINHNTWNVTITRDILRDLPLELVCHVAKYLNPTDVFRLRRVSKDWKAILSQIDVLSCQASLVSEKPCFGRSQSHVEGVLKKQWRLECGQPATVSKLVGLRDNDSEIGDFDDTNSEVGPFDVCNGIIAVARSYDTCSVLCENLKTGKRDGFRIENLQELTSIDEIQLSNQLLAVSLLDGRRYVWDILTKKRKSLPSNNRWCLIRWVSECDVYYETDTGLFRFCFRQNHHHNFGIHCRSLAMRSQGCEKVHILTLETKNGQKVASSISIDGQEEMKNYELVVRSYESHSTESTGLQRYDLSSLLPRLPYKFVLCLKSSDSFRGQTSCLFTEELLHLGVFFSPSECGLIISHRINDWDKHFDFDPIHISQNLMYITRSFLPDLDRYDEHDSRVFVTSGSMASSMPSQTVGYDLEYSPAMYYHERRLEKRIYGTRGDDQFIVLDMDDGFLVWRFDEAQRRPPYSRAY